MAIDPLKKVWLVSPASHARELPERLAAIGLLHVAEVQPAGGQHASAVQRLTADTREVETRIRKLNETLVVLAEFSKTQKDFLSNLIPTPVETTRAQLREALNAIDVDRLHQQAKELAGRRAAAQAAAESARRRLAALGTFRDAPVALPAEGSLRWTQAALWLAPAKPARRVVEAGLRLEGTTLELLATVGSKALVASACLREQADEVSARLREMGFEPVAAPKEATSLDAHVAAIEAELREAEGARGAAVAELTELGRLRLKVELVLGYWEEKLQTALALAKMAATGRAVVLAGFVRAREEREFLAAVAREVPQASAVTEEPSPEENVPVSLTNSAVFRPAQFLVELFGLPSYGAFDPTPFLMLSFVVFYGLCFGDAIYGVVQVAIAFALMRRYRDYPGLRSFFALLAWGGVTSILVGVLTGTWAADIWVPKDENWAQANFLQRALKSLVILDPLKSPLVFLSLALLMGVANQLWGITMKFHGSWRKGDRRGAIFDAGFWYLVLPGLVILVAGLFSPQTPGWLTNLGAGMAVAGAVGLILTQGRNEKSLVGKIIVGIVSLYGIVGSYGCVAFIGDTLSYSRLLALALTTSIVGMAVNIVGGIVREMFSSPAFLGVVAFVVVAVVGHFFNLLLSALGAFIHSARLIFVEFFGRFYEPGAQPFAPLGATGGRIRVTD